jgi:hypothetical protein
VEVTVIFPVIVLTVAENPGMVLGGIVTEAGFRGPPESLHNTHIVLGVFSTIVAVSGRATIELPVTETVTIALVQLIGNTEQT